MLCKMFGGGKRDKPAPEQGQQVLAEQVPLGDQRQQVLAAQVPLEEQGQQVFAEQVPLGDQSQQVLPEQVPLGEQVFAQSSKNGYDGDNKQMVIFFIKYFSATILYNQCIVFI